jgi:hypothetical protein
MFLYVNFVYISHKINPKKIDSSVELSALITQSKANYRYGMASGMNGGVSAGFVGANVVREVLVGSSAAPEALANTQPAPINASISLSTPTPYKPSQFLLQQQQQNALATNQQPPQPPNFVANLRSNKLAQKYLMNSVANYYESIAINSMANNNPNSPVVK